MVEELISPEEREYTKYLKEFNELEKEYEIKKERLNMLKKTIMRFEEKFIRKLALRYRTIDKLDYQLKEYKKVEKFHKREFQSMFKEAEKTFEPLTFKNSKNENKDIKSIYREIVKEIHPDRSRDFDEEKLLTKLMSDVNEAYKNNDKVKMLAIYNNWRNDPDYINEESVAGKLVRVIRQVYNIKNEIEIVEKDVLELQQSELCEFKKEVDRYKRRGIDIMNQMAMSLDKEIAFKRRVVRFFQLLKEASINNSKI
ncbi:J domain-containing protein [Oceanirhabdus sp. W0125-5]|uniref:J domain-containing protein n=1 Tax=Oceanirhabdus sp. W0125-5 TaxID=2999116 RepID=UPI0022F2EC98|nr:J domain-containing protein [Oceanirhabdus sp. W0125-5]WBW95138.1 J domain-containing protein [Oceanirhabdus sp. W0125-5]